MELQHFFEQFGLFSTQELAYIVELFAARSLKKGEFFIQQEQQCREVALVSTGIFRSFYFSPKGDEVTYCFRFPGDLMAAYSSFITGSGSLENMQALISSEVYVISKRLVNELEEELPAWTKLLKLVAEHEYLELERRVFQLQLHSAEDRYRALLKNQPEYVRRIPLQYLASFLGITQRHLSRIRREITIGHMS